MGGYAGKAVAVFSRDGQDSGCFEVYVWHDGDFPFSGEDSDDRGPVHLHHCSAEQFIRFGNLMNKLMEP
jgi:hypothetical protein